MKNRTLLFTLLFLSLLIGKQPNRINPKPEKKRFSIPVLVHTAEPVSIRYMEPDHMPEAASVFLGKFANTDSIFLPIDPDKTASPYTAEEHLNANELRYGTRQLPMDGFQVYPDAQSSMTFITERSNGEGETEAWCFYPVYVVNETSTEKYFHYDNYGVHAIQEAYCEENVSLFQDWFPIEHRPPLSCILNESYIKVRPGEFLLFMMPKYTGSNMTMVRVRVRNGDNTFVSLPFPGKINQGQFYFKPGSQVKKSIQYWPGYIDWYFYGSPPKGFNKNDFS